MRKTKFVPGEFYHIYNRGNSKQEIFFDDQDYERFQKLLYICNGQKSFNFRDDIVSENINAYMFDRGEDIIKICTYALMPNHFHLFVFIPLYQVKGNVYKTRTISDFMKNLTRAYARYFNEKYERSGSLFEGPFKSRHVEDDIYFKYLFAYINLNPVKLLQANWREVGLESISGAGAFLNDYKFSSFYDFFVDPDRLESVILDKKTFTSRLPEGTSLREEILDWLKFSQ